MVRVLAPASKKPEHTSWEANKPTNGTAAIVKHYMRCTLYTLHSIMKYLLDQLGSTLKLSYLTLTNSQLIFTIDVEICKFYCTCVLCTSFDLRIIA